MSPLVVVDDRVCCLEEGCGFKSHSILEHLRTEHQLSAKEYQDLHGPLAATISQKALDALDARSAKVTRVPIPMSDALTVSMMGFTKIPVTSAVAEEDCLPLPDGYKFPTKGRAKIVFERLLMALLEGRNAFIHGMPGTGKDAAVHAYSAITRKPVAMVTFRPGTDLAPWFYTRSISVEGGTGWEYGHLWKALTEGVMGRDGKRYAVACLLSDVDRADSAQAEWFRILVDSISGRILGPDGKMVPLFKGTFFICTANTCGTGDARGRMTSSSPMDASLLDRLGRKIEAAYLHWDDESEILRGKYPLLNEKTPEVFGQLGAATAALRSSIEKEELYAEFTHRGLCEILLECSDILKYHPANKAPPDNLLKRGFCAWLEGMDADSRTTAKRLVDPHLKGGALDTGT